MGSVGSRAPAQVLHRQPLDDLNKKVGLSARQRTHHELTFRFAFSSAVSATCTGSSPNMSPSLSLSLPLPFVCAGSAWNLEHPYVRSKPHLTPQISDGADRLLPLQRRQPISARSALELPRPACARRVLAGAVGSGRPAAVHAAARAGGARRDARDMQADASASSPRYVPRRLMMCVVSGPSAVALPFENVRQHTRSRTTIPQRNSEPYL